MKMICVLTALLALGTMSMAEPAAEVVNLEAMVQDARCKQVLVTCLINGQPVRMMLDTGATHTVLHTASAEKLQGVEWVDTSRMQFKGNSTQRPRLLVSSLQVNNAFAERHAFLVVNLDAVRGMMAEPIDGILGMDVLGSMAFTFDPKNGKFHWGAPKGATLQPLYGTRDDAGRMMVQVKVAGKAMELLLDTGSSLTRVYADTWKPGKGAKRAAHVSDIDKAKQQQVVQGKPADMELAPGVVLSKVVPVFCSRDDRSMLGMDVLKDVVLVHLPTAGMPFGSFFIAK